MKTRTQLLAGGGAAALLAGGLLVPALASADSAPAPTPSATATPGEGNAPRVDRQTELAERLAKELGLPTDRVVAALRKVHDALAAEHRDAHIEALRERLDAAVEDGRLTRAQADAIIAAAEKGVLPAHPHRHGRGGGPGGGGLGGPGDRDGDSGGPGAESGPASPSSTGAALFGGAVTA